MLGMLRGRGAGGKEFAMAEVGLIERRREAEARRREAAVARLRERLAPVARAHGGRFLLYGSTAGGRMHHRSDVDVLLDFPGYAATRAAWDALEEACRDLDLPLDARLLA